jgi:hypothetical protein
MNVILTAREALMELPEKAEPAASRRFALTISRGERVRKDISNHPPRKRSGGYFVKRITPSEGQKAAGRDTPARNIFPR